MTSKTNNRTVRPRRASGFTLIEIIVVLALSLILFGLLVKPLIDALRYSKQAQLRAAAQDSGRKVTEALTRELGSAAYVFDGTTQPFAGAATPPANADLYTNFLDLSVPKISTVTFKVTGYVVAHAYDAKLDFVLARHQSTTLHDPTSGILTDPTTGAAVPTSQEPVNIVSTNGAAHLVPTDLQTPLAPGNTMIRYFVGLLDPTQPYENDRDHIFGNNIKPNTYVLFRAQFSPYNADGTANANLFATMPNPTGGNPLPVLDDPDFFRMVASTDINWLSATHAAFGAVGAASHNNRVKFWMEIAKPVVSAPEIDLLVLPHNTNRTLAADTGLQRFPGIAHYGFTHDPVVGATADPAASALFSPQDWPVVHTSVVFRPSTFTADAAPVTSSDYSSAGVPQMPQNGVTGLPYIPTVYQTVGQSWTNPFTVSIYPVTLAGGGINPIGAPFYTVKPATSTSVASGYAAGDLLEYVQANSAGPLIPVYDVTAGKKITAVGEPAGIPQYLPLSINADSGQISFDVPALPNVLQPFQSRWTTAPVLVGSTPQVNLTTLAGSPLSSINDAHIVPGSIRVYGPDSQSGPNQNLPILYTPIGDSSNATGIPNQYQVDYSTGIITFDTTFPVGSNVDITYDFQANLTPLNVAQPISSTNPAYPMVVKVDYHSRDNLFVQLGVRYFDADENIQIVNLNSQIKVGNNNR